LGRGIGVIDLAEGGMAFYRLGRWDRAGEMLLRASRLAVTGLPRIMVEQRVAMLDVGQGRHELAASRLATARPQTVRVVEPQLFAPLAEAAAELALWQGDAPMARAEIAAALERVDTVPAYISRLGPILALGARRRTSELARAQRDPSAIEASRDAAGTPDVDCAIPRPMAANFQGRRMPHASRGRGAARGDDDPGVGRVCEGVRCDPDGVPERIRSGAARGHLP
jgi:hypothetical protein